MSKQTRGRGGAFTIGRRQFDRISAVEGLRRDAVSDRMFEAFDRTGLSADERRRAIVNMHAPVVLRDSAPSRRRKR